MSPMSTAALKSVTSASILIEPEITLERAALAPDGRTPALLSPYSLQQEKEIHDERLDAALAFAQGESHQ